MTLSAWTCLTTGIPLTLLLDVAAADELDSPAILAAEHVAELATAAWAEAESITAERHSAGGVA